MLLDIFWSFFLVVCSLFFIVQGGYEGSFKGRYDDRFRVGYDDRVRVGYDDRVRVGYEGRFRVMLGEIFLVGIIRSVLLGSLVSIFYFQCCFCFVVNRIYFDRYYVINGNQVFLFFIDLFLFNGMEYIVIWKYFIYLFII